MARTTIRTEDVTAGAISATDIASNSITATQIAANAIGNSEMADDAVGINELSATGTASATTFLRGDNAWASAAAGLESVQVFTASATWTKPTGITKVIVHVQGAGGASVDTTGPAGSGGGGAGGYACKLLDVTNIDTATVTIGAGTAASTGGATTFAKLAGSGSFTDVVGNGGVVATLGYTSDPVAGGTATGGDINIQGGMGAGCNGNDSNQWGGNSFFGSGGRPLSTGDPRSQQGQGPGAGASGGNSGSGVGKAGNDGAVYVWEYK